MDNTGSDVEGNHGSAHDNNNQSATAGPSTTLPPEVMMQLVQSFRAIAEGMPAPVATPRVGGVKDFKSLQPTNFDGSGGPLKAREWIIQIDHILEASLIPEVDKVRVVQIQFVGMARAWYDMLIETCVGPLTWVRFKEEFN